LFCSQVAATCAPTGVNTTEGEPQVTNLGELEVVEDELPSDDPEAYFSAEESAADTELDLPETLSDEPIGKHFHHITYTFT